MKVPTPNEKSGPLAGHVRKGRTYRTPIVATGLLEMGDWTRDDLPDLLWPILTLCELGTDEVSRFVRWQKAAQHELAGQAEPRLIAECLDGRLTGLDRLAARLPSSIPELKRLADEHGLLPESVRNALATYSFRPAKWLVERDDMSPRQEDIDLLARAIIASIKDGHRQAVIKCLGIWSAVQAGTFSTTSETVALLRTYPNDPKTRVQADTVVRAIWGAHRELLLHEDANHFAETIKWAKIFWGVNSMTTACMRSADLTAERKLDAEKRAGHGEPLDGSVSVDALTVEDAPPDGAHLRQLAMDLISSYIQALETAPTRLYDPERQEVHSGLVTRAGREVITALGATDLWCMEHGAHVIRVLVEVRIYIQWMSQQDPAIYRTFQEYGAGKAKLYARIMDELPAEARRPDFEEALKDLRKLSHNDEIFDHRVVDTRDSFAAGKSIRTMAQECGLIDLYRQAYSMASGVAHSEWWSVEANSMERCLNILHRGHLIPSLSLSAGGNVALAASWVDQLYALVRVSLQILGTDKSAIDTAFAWIDSGNEESETLPGSGARKST